TARARRREGARRGPRGGEAGAGEPPVLGGRALERRGVGVALPGGADLLGDAGAEGGLHPLPLEGEHPMALEVAERAVVRDDLEAVAERLEAAAGAVPPGRAVGDEPRGRAAA